MFKATTAIKKILALKARKKIIQGGSGAGKTIAILSILIDKAIRTPGLEISVVSESVPHLKKGAMKDFIKVMKSLGRWSEDHWNATDRKYTFSNESYIEFFSPEAILGARRNILYINEANNVSYSDYHQLSIRTSDDIFIDHNPSTEYYAHTEILKEPNSEILVLTYKDNEARPVNVDEDFDVARAKAQKEEEQGLPVTAYWRNWCRVYIDGEVGNLQGVVFENWHIIPEITQEINPLCYGLDFGYVNDPTALIAVYENKGELFVKELLYQTKLTNSDIIKKLNQLVTKGIEIIADSAEPKSIEEISRAGFRIKGANKGPDSVRNSIDKLQQYKINVTADSLNLIKELRSYRWLTDKAGKALNQPVDYQNHLIDALRYVALNKLGKSSGVWDYSFSSI
jgi:phage terminase large subunit